MTRRYSIPEGESGKRLDAVLSGLTGRTRSSLQALFRQSLITIDGNPVSASHKVKSGDEVEVKEPVLEKAPPPPDLKILYEDSDMMVVDKPAGLVVHLGESGRQQPSVAAFALSRGVKDDDAERPGVVHRLDKDTSGVLVIAKHPEAKSHLQDQFRQRTVEKTYLALVRGTLDPPEATVNLPISRHRQRPTKRAVVPGGRPAVTRYKTLERFNGASLIEIGLETGRTHQIRVHMAHLGHPVLGDELYGGETTADTKRQMLHAVKISLRSPSGKRIEVVSDMPVDMVTVIENLRKRL